MRFRQGFPAFLGEQDGLKLSLGPSPRVGRGLGGGDPRFRVSGHGQDSVLTQELAGETRKIRLLTQVLWVQNLHYMGRDDVLVGLQAVVEVQLAERGWAVEVALPDL